MGKHRRRWNADELEVRPGDTAGLRAWAEQVIYWDPGEFEWSYSARHQRYFIDRVAQLAREDISLAADEWDTLLWNLPMDAGGILIAAGVELADRLRLVRSLAAVVLKVTPRAEEELSGFMFWDVLVHTYWNHSFDRVEAAAVRDSLFAALAAQLQEPSKALQMGALHGLNHLQDPRTGDLVASQRDQFIDDEVREFSESAAVFAWP
jgi:hypothetical protein